MIHPGDVCPEPACPQCNPVRLEKAEPFVIVGRERGGELQFLYRAKVTAFWGPQRDALPMTRENAEEVLRQVAPGETAFRDLRVIAATDVPELEAEIAREKDAAGEAAWQRQHTNSFPVEVPRGGR